MLLVLVTLMVARADVVKPGVNYTLADQSDWAHLVLDVAYSMIDIGFMSRKFIYAYPPSGGIAGPPNAYAIPAALSADVAYASGNKVFMSPAATPNKLVIVDCDLATKSCPFTVSSTISLGVPSNTKWTTIAYAPSTSAGIYLCLFSSDFFVQLSCTIGFTSSCSSPQIIDLKLIAPKTAFYSNIVSVASIPPSMNINGDFYIARANGTGSTGPGQVLTYAISSKSITQSVYTETASKINMIFYATANLYIGWSQDLPGKHGAFAMFNIQENSNDEGKYYTIDIPLKTSSQVFTTGTVDREAVGGAAYVVTGDSQYYYVHHLDLSGRAVDATALKVHGTAPYLSYCSQFPGVYHGLWVATKDSSGNNQVLQYYKDLVDEEEHPPEGLPTSPATSPHPPSPTFPYQTDCKDASMPATCWRSCSQDSKMICGPRTSCPESSTSCYVLSSGVDCCDYCPPEWSGGCQ